MKSRQTVVRYRVFLPELVNGHRNLIKGYEVFSGENQQANVRPNRNRSPRNEIGLKSTGPRATNMGEE
jgi:hypothetical protein